MSFDVVAQKIQADLAEAGINVTLKPGEINTELQNYRDGNEGLGFWLWGPDYFDSNDYLAFLPEGIVGKRANWTNANSDPRFRRCATRSTSRRIPPSAPRCGSRPRTT